MPRKSGSVPPNALLLRPLRREGEGEGKRVGV
jgi:hypothetical protein